MGMYRVNIWVKELKEKTVGKGRIYKLGGSKGKMGVGT